MYVCMYGRMCVLVYVFLSMLVCMCLCASTTQYAWVIVCKHAYMCVVVNTHKQASGCGCVCGALLIDHHVAANQLGFHQLAVFDLHEDHAED